MPGTSQLDKMPEPLADPAQLLTPSTGPKIRAGLVMTDNVGIGYIASSLRGQGAAALRNMMEDAATADISRTRLRQWRKTGQKLDSGEVVDDALIRRSLDEQLEVWKRDVGDNFCIGQVPRSGRSVRRAGACRRVRAVPDGRLAPSAART